MNENSEEYLHAVDFSYRELRDRVRACCEAHLKQAVAMGITPDGARNQIHAVFADLGTDYLYERKG